MRVLLLITFIPIIFCGTAFDELQNRYVTLSMELVTIFKNRPEVTEAELHSIAKAAILENDFSKKQFKLLEEFAEKKGAEFQTAFSESFLAPRLENHVLNRINSVLGYYLTKKQIEKFRTVVLDHLGKGHSKEEIVNNIKANIAEELGSQNASKAVDLVMKDLKILHKMYSDLIEKLDQPLGHFLKDEL